MRSIIVYDLVTIDVEARAVVGEKRPGVLTRFIDPEFAVVVNGEPFEAVGDTGEALQEVVARHVQFSCVNGADRFQFLEFGKVLAFGRNEIDVAAESSGDDYCRSKMGDIVLRRGWRCLAEGRGCDEAAQLVCL